MPPNATAAAAADVHLKMCKKVAQLTKVIFQLNTRNEDFQAEAEHVRSTHAAELRMLTQDATDTIKTLHDALATQTATAAQQERWHRQERERILAEAQDLQQRMHAGRVAVEETLQAKVTDLAHRVQRAQDAFEERLVQLTHCAQERENALEKTCQQEVMALQARLDVVGRAHADDREQLVTTLNAKYDEMVAEQLRRQDEVRATLVRAQHEWDDQEREKAAEHERQQKRHAVSAQSAYDTMQHELSSQIEGLLGDVEGLRASERTLRQDKESLVDSLHEATRRTQELEGELATTQQEAQRAQQDAAARAEESQRMLAGSTDKVDELTLALETLTQSLQTRDRALKQTQQEVETLQRELSSSTTAAAEAQARLSQQVQAYEVEVVDLTSTCQGALAQSQAGQEQIQRLETERLAVHDKLKALETEAASTRSKLEQELERAARALNEANVAHERALEACQRSNAQHCEQLLQSHALEVETHRCHAANALERAATQWQEASLQTLNATIAELQRTHEQLVTERDATATAVQAQQRQELELVRGHVKTLEDQVAARVHELTALQVQHEETNRQWQTSEQQVARLHVTLDALESATVTAEKEREEGHAKQLQDMQREADKTRRLLEDETKTLEQQHARTLQQLAQAHAVALEARTAELNKERSHALLAQESALRQEYEPQLAALRDELTVRNQASKDALETARALEETWRLAQEELRSAGVRFAEQTEAERARVERLAGQDRERLARDHARHVHDVEQRLRDDLRAHVARRQAEADAAVARLVADHRQEVDRTAHQHAQALHELETTLTQASDRALVAAKAETMHQLARVRVQCDRERAEALEKAHATFDQQYREVRDRMEATATSLTTKTLEWASAVRDAQHLSGALATKTEELASQRVAFETQARDDVAALNAAWQRELDTLVEAKSVEMKQVRDEFEAARRVLVATVASLEATSGEWQEKYARRDSRPEDVAQIAELEHQVVEKDAVVQRIRDEMAYLKREVLNREEMYNKTFARTPNVGLLQVLKPHVPLPSGDGQRRRSERSGKVLPPLHTNQGS